jgi:hypothetical protein
LAGGVRWVDGADRVSVRAGRVAAAGAGCGRRVDVGVGGEELLALAEDAGHDSPDGLQHLLRKAKWDTDGVRDDLRRYVVERLGTVDAVLVVDGPTGVVRSGKPMPCCRGIMPGCVWLSTMCLSTSTSKAVA